MSHLELPVQFRGLGEIIEPLAYWSQSQNFLLTEAVPAIRNNVAEHLDQDLVWQAIDVPMFGVLVKLHEFFCFSGVASTNSDCHIALLFRTLQGFTLGF